jgi:riboflavin kinase / FMN adenylyltransferase
MKILTHISEINQNESLAVTMGNFDGLHLGHKKFITEFVQEAKTRKSSNLVVTFVPHPLTILKNKLNFLINTYEQRRSFMEDLGVEYLLELDFSRDFSTQLPETFLDSYIFSHPGISFFYLGHDFSFGANKTGDHEFMRSFCTKRKIDFKIQNEFKVGDSSLSSSFIRDLLTQGDVEGANIYLGREYFLEGFVVKGEGRGKKIGFPTANIEFDHSLLTPAKGVYITNTITQGEKYISVTNIGVNPTFVSKFKITVETHLLDFSRDLYGEKLTVIFLKKIRDEIKFPNVNELITQIKKDIEFCRTIHRKN